MQFSRHTFYKNIAIGHECAIILSVPRARNQLEYFSNAYRLGLFMQVSAQVKNIPKNILTGFDRYNGTFS